MNDNDYFNLMRKETAQKLLSETAIIAAALEDLANDRNVSEAQRTLRDHIDGNWHAVVVGNCTSVGHLLYEDCPEQEN